MTSRSHDTHGTNEIKYLAIMLTRVKFFLILRTSNATIKMHTLTSVGLYQVGPEYPIHDLL